MVNSFDVAKLAGVSQTTVSRALRGDERVSERTRRLVEQAAQSLSYVPNPAGRALSSGRTDRIAFLVTDLTNEFYHRIIAPLAEALQKRGKELVLQVDVPDLKFVPERIQALGVDGVILGTTTTESMVPYYLKERGIPFVYFNRTSPSAIGDVATVDSTQGYHQMLESALQFGHRQVALINGPSNSTTGYGRAIALKSFLAERGVSIPSEYDLSGNFSIDTGRKAFGELMKLEDPPSIVVCGNDTIAYGAKNEAVLLGIDIPGEVSVVGFDNLPESAQPVYDLSSIGYDLERLVEGCVELLLARVEAPETPIRSFTIPTTFVPRGSLGEAPGRSPQ